MSDIRGPLIDGFSIGCGKYNTTITLKDDIYTIGCWKGMCEEEVIKVISEKYSGKEKEAYLVKLDEAKDMSWLTDELHEQLKDDKNRRVKLAVAQYSDRYHEQLKNDTDEDVRVAAIKFNNEHVNS